MLRLHPYIYSAPKYKFMSDQEQDCVFVCSRGILKSCDIHSKIPCSSSGTMSDYDEPIPNKPFSIYVCNTAIRRFIETVLPKITQPFVLVSGDSDTSVPFDIFATTEEFESFVQNPLIIRWYSQNCTISDHPKLAQMPIGLDYHTMTTSAQHWGPRASPQQQESMLMVLRNQTQSRVPKAYCNFQFAIHHSKFGNDRHDAIRDFPADLTYYEPRQTLRVHAWITQTNYAFVLSPHGNGLDCHRTWEALCLGCIPIVKTSALDPMYAGLPVLILDDWSQATDTMLAQKLEELTPLFSSPECQEKLHLNYWMERIRRDVFTYNNINIHT